MSPFDDDLIMNRLFDRLDQMEAKIDLKADNILSKVDDLCSRMTRQETRYDDHVQGKKDRKENTDRKIYIVLGIFGAVISLYEVIKSGIIG